MKKQLSNLEKLRMAWKNAPIWAKSRVHKNHTHQKVADILKNGHKDKTIIENLLVDIKEYSEEVPLSLEKLRMAWKNAPTGAISRVYRNYTHQNVADILEKGRRDETIIENLLVAIKESSEEVAQEISKHNQTVQDL
jgi:hypothetical protein